MSSASSSSTTLNIIRQNFKRSVRPSRNLRPSPPTTSGNPLQSRNFAAAALEKQPEVETIHSDLSTPSAYTGSSESSTSTSSSPSSSKSNRRPPRSNLYTPTTPARAQSYLTDLLQLPSSQQFPPELSLQILTHKSFRFAHLIRHRPSSPSFLSSSSRTSSSSRSNLTSSSNSIPGESLEDGPSSVPHNSRLSFLGRRALSAYLTLFLHSNLRDDMGVKEIDFLRGKSLQEKLDNLRHCNNLGREVGGRWGVGEVMRWDRNDTGREAGDARIKGLTVESILGGIFTQLGSPAAQRTFHLHILPYLSEQLRDPILKERVEVTRREVEKEFKGGIV